MLHFLKTLALDMFLKVPLNFSEMLLILHNCRETFDGNFSHSTCILMSDYSGILPQF